MVKTKAKSRSAAAPVQEMASPHAPREHKTWSPGDRAHQGDLILVALSCLPKSAKMRKDRQMADGGTIGSRHILEGGEVWDANAAELHGMLKALGLEVDEKYIGPVFSGACTLTHPQHAHQVFPEHEATVVVFQRNLDIEEREVRARD